MARTPLLRSLRRLFLDHAVARKRGLPVDAVRDLQAREREKGITRRQVLTGAAVGATALALPKGVRAAGNQPVVAIVGGGIAGLTCALELADMNIASTVYEASGRVGGRMFTNDNYFSDGQVAEWGGELIDTGHKTVRKLAQRFGLKLDNLLNAQPDGADDIFRFDGQYYPKSQADVDFAAVFDAISADADAAGYPTTYDSFTAAGAQLSQMSIRQYVDQRIPGGHHSPLGQLLEVAYIIEYGADASDQSALNLLYLLAFQPDPDHFSVFGESDEKFHIRGGNQRLPEAIAAHLGPDVVKTGKKLCRLKQKPSGRYELTFQSGAPVVADYVVLALPFAVLKEIDTDQAGFDELKQTAIDELGEGHNGKLQLQFTSRPWLGTGPWPGVSAGGSYSDTGYQASWEATRAQAGQRGVLVFYSGGSVTDAMSSNTAFATASSNLVIADANRALAQVASVYPGAPSRWNGKALQSLPHKSNLFRASYAYYKVGQYTEFGGYEKVRQGGILFAGEHTSTDFQGFMEGGASEGARAAKQVHRLVT